MQYNPNKWQVKIKRNDFMYTTQHSFPTESSSQLLTEIHDLKKKKSLNYSKKKTKHNFFPRSISPPWLKIHNALPYTK